MKQTIHIAVEQHTYEDSYRVDSHSSLDVLYEFNYYVYDTIYLSKPFIIEDNDRNRLFDYLAACFITSSEDDTYDYTTFPKEGYSPERTREIIGLFSFLSNGQVAFDTYNEQRIISGDYRRNSFKIERKPTKFTWEKDRFALFESTVDSNSAVDFIVHLSLLHKNNIPIKRELINEMISKFPNDLSNYLDNLNLYWGIRFEGIEDNTTIAPVRICDEHGRLYPSIINSNNKLVINLKRVIDSGYSYENLEILIAAGKFKGTQSRPNEKLYDAFVLLGATPYKMHSYDCEQFVKEVNEANLNSVKNIPLWIDLFPEWLDEFEILGINRRRYKGIGCDYCKDYMCALQKRLVFMEDINRATFLSEVKKVADKYGVCIDENDIIDKLLSYTPKNCHLSHIIDRLHRHIESLVNTGSLTKE